MKSKSTAKVAMNHVEHAAVATSIETTVDMNHHVINQDEADIKAEIKEKIAADEVVEVVVKVDPAQEAAMVEKTAMETTQDTEEEADIEDAETLEGESYNDVIKWVISLLWVISKYESYEFTEYLLSGGISKLHFVY